MDKRGGPSERTKRYERRCRMKSSNSSEQESNRQQSRSAKAGTIQANKHRKVARVAPTPRTAPAAPESDDDLELNQPEQHHTRSTGCVFQFGLFVIFVLVIFNFASMRKQPQMALIALQNTTRGEQEKPSAVSSLQDNHENVTYVSFRLSCSFVNDAKSLNEIASIYQEPKPIWKVTTDLVFKIASFVTYGQPGKRVKLKYRPTNGNIIKVTNGSSVIKYKCIGCDLSFVLNHTHSN